MHRNLMSTLRTTNFNNKRLTIILFTHLALDDLTRIDLVIEMQKRDN